MFSHRVLVGVVVVSGVQLCGAGDCVRVWCLACT